VRSTTPLNLFYGRFQVLNRARFLTFTVILLRVQVADFFSPFDQPVTSHTYKSRTTAALSTNPCFSN
jgi:hypothetical protein